jgi:hypothetical protein
MMENDTRPLKAALYGMDSRAIKTIMQFLQGPCNGVAYVVMNEDDADVAIFDSDSPASKKLLENHVLDNPQKPTIVFSLRDFVQKGTINIKKPVTAHDMLLALEQTKTIIYGLTEKTTEQETTPTTAAQNEEDQPKPIEAEPVIVGQDEPDKTAKHQTALCLDEKNLKKYVNAFEDFNLSNPKQLSSASYNPKNFYQGYFQTALEIAKSNKQIMLLESDWCPITLFPRSQEVWLEAGDQELKGFAGIKLNRKIMAADLFLTRIDPEKVSLTGALDKFQSVESFLWKLACWTSRGRYPQDIDYQLPIFLKSWPNFTRLMVTPHALRIAALLIQGPRTMDNIAQSLNIKHQYVFVFISAAYAIGLADQVKRAADSLVQAPDLPKNERQGLFGLVIKKLHSK